MTEPATRPAIEPDTGRAAGPDTGPAAGARVLVRSPGELVAVTPYLLGFHPTDSLVLIALPATGNSVQVTVRADLTEARQDGIVDYLAALVAFTGGRRLLVLVYGAAPPAARGGSAPPGCVPSGCGSLGSGAPVSGAPEPATLPDRDVVRLIGTAAALLDVELLTALYVAGGRWWCYLPCGSRECCPPAGAALLGHRSPVVETAVSAGLTALPDRAALAATFDPVDGGRRRGMARAVAVALRELVAAAAADGGIGPWRVGALVLLRSVLTGISQGTVPWLADPEAARLVVGLTDEVVRDVAWTWTNESPARCGPAGELWRQLGRRAEEPYSAPPLFLAAWAAWRSGRGTVALVALERALAADPGYSAALLLEQLISRCHDPATAGELIAPCPLVAGPSTGRHRRRTRPRDRTGGVAVRPR